jgi:hypothetical protein
MTTQMNRRSFIKGTLLSSAALAVSRDSHGQAQPKSDPAPAPSNTLPKGKIGNLEVSRLILGGNLLTHFTHSRDLKYVYALAAHYNTDEKIMETIALAEKHGINTLSMHNPPHPMSVLRRYRKQGGTIQWIICPTAKVDETMQDYTEQVRELLDAGCEAIYLWGVHSDKLISAGRIDLIAEAVELTKRFGVPSGVGAHDLRVIIECEKNKIPADFYIKTLHHHNYPSAPKPDQIRGPYAEHPGYWCSDPKAVIDFMKDVKKPWIAFKVMAAGAIPPAGAFKYAFENGADHILAGMFDFEITEDVQIVKETLGAVQQRQRLWRS